MIGGQIEADPQSCQRGCWLFICHTQCHLQCLEECPATRFDVRVPHMNWILGLRHETFNDSNKTYRVCVVLDREVLKGKKVC